VLLDSVRALKEQNDALRAEMNGRIATLETRQRIASFGGMGGLGGSAGIGLVMIGGAFFLGRKRAGQERT